MNIGVDVDEVLADFVPALIAFHNTAYQTSFTREQFSSYRFWEVWGGTREQAIEKVYLFYQTSYFQQIVPVKGSQRELEKLKSFGPENSFYIITSRQKDISEATNSWVKQHFPNIFSEIFFTNHYSRSGKVKTKKEICEILEIDLLVEDSLDYALECSAPSRRILLLDCPWNQKNPMPPEIQRVFSWSEIAEEIFKNP
ncbi:hypothetical protein HYX13_05460 [Candidatus Woesearchaeota archaeon]|nr:hypothetical protein [Candidatus Woesearchaeota archaeon]